MFIPIQIILGNVIKFTHQLANGFQQSVVGFLVTPILFDKFTLLYCQRNGLFVPSRRKKSTSMTMMISRMLILTLDILLKKCITINNLTRHQVIYHLLNLNKKLVVTKTEFWSKKEMTLQIIHHIGIA